MGGYGFLIRRHASVCVGIREGVTLKADDPFGNEGEQHRAVQSGARVIRESDTVPAIPAQYATSCGRRLPLQAQVQNALLNAVVHDQAQHRRDLACIPRDVVRGGNDAALAPVLAVRRRWRKRRQ